jgi:hypothetical protein
MGRIGNFRIGNLLLLAGLVAFMPALPAPAQDADIRFIDRTGASSACVGDPKTAVCAVETALACRIRQDAALCERVRLDGAVTPKRPGGNPNPDPIAVLNARAIEYFVKYAKEKDDGTARVEVSVRLHGSDGLVWPDRGGRRLKYELRRDGAGWVVAGVAWQPFVRYVDRTGGGKCVGDVSSPVCTVVTHIACRVRDDPALCELAGVVESKHFRPKGATVLYTVARIRRWEPPEPAAPGSIFVIVEVWESTQWQPGSRPGEAIVVDPAFIATRYTLERLGGVWRVTGRAERP